jgi:protein-L-isoaspartate(D-aspartate) O-methyltransferase
MEHGFDFVRARAHMVETQLKRRGIRDTRVLEAMGEVPREAFVEPALSEFAYEDSALPIAEGQTISQPYIVALMLEAAAIKPHAKGPARVLEIGAGSGYAAAVISRLASDVFAMERHAPLAMKAAERFRRLGYHNIALKIGDGSPGWPEAAPFDAILVAAAASAVPESLKYQLEIGGRLVVPVTSPGGNQSEQMLLSITRAGEEEFLEERLAPVRFVPLIGTG